MTRRNPELVETERILALPVRGWPDAEDVEIESHRRLHPDAFARGERLLPAQVAGLLAWDEVGGGLFPIGVGHGKTGLSLMIAQDALARKLARRVLLVTPVQLVAGLARRHLPEWRRRVSLPMTIHYVSGLSPAHRKRLAASGAPGCYVFPYSLLSRPDTLDLLREISPDLVIADEAHRLKHPRSACTKRLMSAMAERQPRPRFVAMSGTLTSKGIMEYHHMAVAALGDRAPLPRQASMAYAWGMVLDAGAEPPPGMTETVLGPLVAWAEESGPDAPRRAYQRRLTTAPGVVSTGDSRPGASLVIRDVAPEDGPSPELVRLMTRVTRDYETPGGEPIDHAIHCYKWMHELSAGFYNDLVWPTPAELARGRRIPEADAEEQLRRARQYQDALTEYHRELRQFFREAPPGLDTPREVALAISEGRVGGTLAMAWERTRALDFAGRPERRRVPVRVCDFKVRAAVAWAKEHGRGIIWTYHQEVGRWAHEALRQAGVDALHCPAGEDATLEAAGDPMQGGAGDRVVVASLPAHGVGRNLQAFDRCLYLQWPRDCALAEQSLGRIHRTGQQADEVVAYTLMALQHDRTNRAATLSDATYVQQTTGASQRVLYCDYDPLPEIYPDEWLRERGATPIRLDPRARSWAKERFGGFSEPSAGP